MRPLTIRQVMALSRLARVAEVALAIRGHCIQLMTQSQYQCPWVTTSKRARLARHYGSGLGLDGAVVAGSSRTIVARHPNLQQARADKPDRSRPLSSGLREST
jgi:hypothetical protein